MAHSYFGVITWTVNGGSFFIYLCRVTVDMRQHFADREQK